MLGHGPIVAGYSIIATVGHEPSMMDLDGAVARRLEDFTETVREQLRNPFGPAVITEHGRVAPCVATPTQAYEPHCLHAHRLVFPGLPDLDVETLAAGFKWRRYASFADLRDAADRPLGQYLACQPATGEAIVADVSGPLPRQFFRTLAAITAGHPELADWRRDRGDATIEAARKALGRP